MERNKAIKNIKLKKKGENRKWKISIKDTRKKGRVKRKMVLEMEGKGE